MGWNQPNDDMPPTSPTTVRLSQVFLLRIWGEARELPEAAPTWRGTIEHLPTRTRAYFQDLAGIILFILPYLEEMGVRVSWPWRLRRWLRQRPWRSS